MFVVFRRPADKNRIVAATLDGQPLLNTGSPKVFAKTEPADGTFTFALWVKPAAITALPRQANAGLDSYFLDNNFVLFPTQGDNLVPGGGHAGSGLAVGKNGVCVFEHGANYFSPVLTYPTVLKDWTHIAVVYRDGRPRLYLNGVFVKEGLKGPYTVHLGAEGGGGGKPFVGNRGCDDRFLRALDDKEVEQLAKSTPRPYGESGVALALTYDKLGSIEARFDHPGTYELKFADGRTLKKVVSSIPEPIALSGPWDVEFPPQRVRF